MSLKKKSVHHYIKWTFYSSLSGLLAGISSAFFLFSLKWVTDTRDLHPVIIWGLPLAGLFIGWVYHQFGKEAARGNNLILDEIHNPRKVLPFRMAPLVLGGTLLTHLFGGSAGREGTAVQMGASLSDQLSKIFKLSAEERKILLAAGAGAGFGAAIGAPWAGVVFGMEMIHVGKLRLFAWFECLVASWVGYGLCILLEAPHTHYPLFDIPTYTFQNFFFILLAGILFGLVAQVFVHATHAVEKWQSKWVSFAPLRPFWGGIFLIILFYIEGSYRYVGLGLPYIQQALVQMDSFRDPALKTFFTAITLGSGFKGGEFIPLVYIGTTLGSALGLIFPISYQLLAGVGFAALFGAASNTPIACSLMAIEIFGPRIAPYAFLACFVGYYFSGRQTIYRSQKFNGSKRERTLALLSLLGELPKRFVSVGSHRSGKK